MENATKTTDKAVAADRRKVVNGAATGKCRIIVDVHVSSEHHVVRHNYPITHFAIVSDVATSHHVAIVANPRDPVFFLRCSIDGYRFTENVSIPDDDLSRRTLVAEVLRLSTDDDAWEEMIVSSHRGVSRNSNVVL